MKISDLIKKGVLTKEARTDIAFFQRANPDGTFSYSKINIQEIINNPSSATNLDLLAKDRLIIYNLDRYADRYEIVISGAVRNEQKYPYDPSQTLKVEDAILLSGGLKAEAAEIAYIIRTKPEEPTTKEYIRINLKNVLTNKQSPDNLVMKPSDQLLVLSASAYQDVFQIKVDGAVRNPGAFQYDKSLTLKDVLTLSGGLRLDAASNRIEVSRVVMKNSEPTRIVIATLTVDENFEAQGGNYKLEPFDQISVRSAPEFAFQKTITLNGEVRYPGTYTLITKNETLKSVIERAGGLTSEAFWKGAQLFRGQESIGFVVMDLEQALQKGGNNRYNYILKEGDVITIPKSKDFVTIQGATRAQEMYIGAVSTGGQISTPYHAGRSARFYIEKYSGGFAKDAKRSDVTVVHSNGRVVGTTNFGLFKIYPKPSKGAIVRVAYKENEVKEEGGEKKEKVDWEKLFANTIAQASGILTLILLAQQLSK
jgi:protein involved in polysaccharide export with SLBB domain